MAALDSTGRQNLKFKLTLKRPSFDSEEKSQKIIRKSIVRNGERDSSCVHGRNERSELKVLVKPSTSANSSKRKAEMSLDGHTGKRQKMDLNVKVHCRRILKELMRCPGWDIFSEPVDPVKLKIPDYFSIITHPMDLGTIKLKLEGNMYFSAEEFAADVTLTFSNAMTYNPHWHQVHKVAKQFEVYFSKAWKETKLKGENKTVKQATSVDDMGRSGKYAKQTIQKNCPETKLFGLNKVPVRGKSGTSGQVSSEEKNHEETIPVAPNKALVRACRPKVVPSRREPDGRHLSLKTVQKDHCGPSARAFANHGQSHDSSEAKCGSCGCLTCHCHFKNHSAQASLSDISSERSSSEHDRYGQSGPDCEGKTSLALSRSSGGVDSDGPGVVVNEENSSHLSTPAIDEGWSLLDLQMSPNKALRVAKLKSRFADTIFRATHQAVLDHGDKSDPVRMQHERERLEREQLAEKARIEAEIKAAEAASQKRAQDELKMQRERAREAARMALQMMEKTVQIDENLVSLKKLEMLCSPTGEGFGPGSPLEQLGLFMKDDYLSEDDEDEDAILTGEEGEILS